MLVENYFQAFVVVKKHQIEWSGGLDQFSTGACRRSDKAGLHEKFYELLQFGGQLNLASVYLLSYSQEGLKELSPTDAASWTPNCVISRYSDENQINIGWDKLV